MKKVNVEEMENAFEDNYYKIISFISKLSKPKLRDQALVTMRRLDDSKGETAREIFENGSDNAEALIATEARDLLSSLKLMKLLDIKKMSVDAQLRIFDEKELMIRAWKVSGGSQKGMQNITGMPARSVRNKIKLYGLNKQMLDDQDFAQ